MVFQIAKRPQISLLQGWKGKLDVLFDAPNLNMLPLKHNIMLLIFASSLQLSTRKSLQDWRKQVKKQNRLDLQPICKHSSSNLMISETQVWFRRSLSTVWTFWSMSISSVQFCKFTRDILQIRSWSRLKVSQNKPCLAITQRYCFCSNSELKCMEADPNWIFCFKIMTSFHLPRHKGLKFFLYSWFMHARLEAHSSYSSPAYSCTLRWLYMVIRFAHQFSCSSPLSSAYILLFLCIRCET